jgi:diacylglycerol O-acyltransferase
MTRLSIIDNGFLLTESHHSPKHIAGLQIFRLPRGKGPAWLRKLLDDMKQAPTGFPFNQRLKTGSAVQPELEIDQHFEIDYHVRHSVLPHPGSDDQLLDVAARLHANLLDRERPLWEFHLIEGLSDRRFAFYTKIHHSLCDGVTFGRWLDESSSLSQEEKTTPPIWHRDESPRDDGGDMSYAQMMVEGIKMLGGGVKTALGISALSAKLVQRRFIEGDLDIALPLSAPKTRLNVATGAARNLTIRQYPLDEFRAIAKSQKVSINDVVMTICDLAVSRYCEEAHDAPDAPLVAYMPVNLRTDNDQEDGNLISLIQVKLASNHEDPLASLQQVRKSSRSARELFFSASRPAIQYYSMIVALLSLFEETLRLDRFLTPVNNMVISNVPGSPVTQYFRGAEVVGMYPVSTLPPMTALNVTACSYAGTFFFGLVSGKTAIPDLEKLTERLDQTFAELKELSGV